MLFTGRSFVKRTSDRPQFMLSAQNCPGQNRNHIFVRIDKWHGQSAPRSVEFHEIESAWCLKKRSKIGWLAQLILHQEFRNISNIGFGWHALLSDSLLRDGVLQPEAKILAKITVIQRRSHSICLKDCGAFATDSTKVKRTGYMPSGPLR